MYVLMMANLKHLFNDAGDACKYANIIVYEIDHTKFSRHQLLQQFANAIQALSYLHGAGLPKTHCCYLEQVFFTNLPDELRVLLRNMARRVDREIRSRVAAVVWDPDYVWPTGCTTMEIMNERWKKRIKHVCDIKS